MQAAAAEAVMEGASYCAATARAYLHPGAIEFWLPVVPALAYWLLSGLYEVLDRLQLPATEACRLHSQAQADKKNVLTKGHVLGRVLIQHAIQCATSWAFTVLDPGMCERTRALAGGGAGAWLRAGGTWLLGMLVFDAWQYGIHRAMHESKALYNAFHSVHHRLLVPYAFGALYNHPVEAFLLDTLGSLVTVLASGMSCEMAVVFYTFSTLKTVFDHSGYRWPVNPVHPLFPNNAAVHDAHHDLRGFRKNYSQPFFVHWDWLLGTYLDPAELTRLAGQKGGAAAAGAGAKAAAAAPAGAGDGRAEARQAVAAAAPGSPVPASPGMVTRRRAAAAQGSS